MMIKPACSGSREELYEVTRIVRHEGKVFRDDALHQTPVCLAAHPQPVHVPCLVPVHLGDPDERRMQTLVDQKSHVGASPLSVDEGREFPLRGVRFDDLST
jgi:hypothetical protein